MTRWTRAWRPALRMARRDALRARGRSALVLVMIALPVLAIVALDVIARTADVSTVEGLDRRLGRADALVSYSGNTSPVVQSPTLDYQADATPQGDQQRPELPTPTARTITDVLPGARVTEVRQGTVAIRTDLGVSRPTAVALDLRRPVTRGLYRLTSGRYPRTAGEVLVSRRLAQRGFTPGTTLRFAAGGTARVVGLAESGATSGLNQLVGLPGALPFETGGPFGKDIARDWLVQVDGALGWRDVKALNTHGLFALSRSVVEHPPPASQVDVPSGLSGSGLSGPDLTVLALIVAMALLEVVLLAGPAFAVGVKRQERALALMAATGAQPPDLRKVVLASGVVLGAAAGVTGAIVGIAAAWVSLPFVQTFSTERFGPFQVEWRDVAGIAACGLLSALLAALFPALMAARQDVVAVLAGRRGHSRQPVWSPLLGAVLLGLGITGAVLGARRPSGGELPITGSAVLSVLGMVLLIPLAVGQLGRLARVLPLPLRFAVRDAARQRGRTAPAVAAVAAVVAGAVALGIGGSSDGAETRATYTPSAPAGAALVQWCCGPDDWARAGGWPVLQAAVTRQIPGATVHRVAGVPDDLSPSAVDGGSSSGSGGDAYRTLDIRSSLENTLGWSSNLGTSVLVGRSALDVLPGLVSAADRSRARRTLDAGGVVLLASRATSLTSAQLVVQDVPTDGKSEPVDVTSQRVPATTVAVPGSPLPARAVLSSRAARAMRLPIVTSGLVLTGPTIDQQTEDRAQEAAQTISENAAVYVERGFHDSSTSVALLILGVVGAVLVLGGTLTATFLALSDARPDFATMGAVGAAPGTRRTVAAAYALTVGLVGALLGAAVGFVPGIAVTYPLTSRAGYAQPGITAADGTPLPGHFLDIPWLLVLGLVVGLPLLAAAVVAASTRSRLPMVSRLT